mmetsp:Transcript_9060/g.12019  ORF Transcript_9060/g.12019 Transcript_9060/m.12019 type:complete len:555 (+) Transcript_9060:249-1913(+)|eukprot:CAMPEP_0117744148 /NCGR_PEP_ID=MMETSP0947-20121206/6574_1 /TAXON_ID=44440 /ORGANISM="Chattonella subsalsa, Strain CCMP2191" /LENGTH=554 /DNA_ID=CAMNT_0005561017 /DNA_START=226 /DNA_END=1890 /DNA_ORIENTATION=-
MASKVENPLRLCVIYSASEGCVYDGDDPPADVAQHLRRSGKDNVFVEEVELTPQNFPSQLVDLSKRFEEKEIDCIINLCDGAWDEPSVGIGAVDLLENKLNLPFTGAGVDFYEPSRLQMKKAALAVGEKVPSWRFLYSIAEMESFLLEFDSVDIGDAPMSFPLLVKHFSSYSSVGLTKDSKVSTVAGLRKQCERMLSTYGGCLVEEFIVGREFTVLVAQVPDPDTDTQLDVKAFPPVECAFGEGEDFKHYNLKWIDYENIAWSLVQDQGLSDRLQTLACGIFSALNGRGYGRVDVRSDPSGKNLYFLEINPNCGIFYPEGAYGSADFILHKTDPTHAHADFVLNQVEVAIKMHQNTAFEKNGTCQSKYDTKHRSWGMFACRDIQIGEVIFNYEEKAFHLVSKQHVLKTWNRDKTHTWENFVAYCWPVADELFAMWSPNPDDWKPINHSCDPNSWNEDGNGLNIVARRSIKAGDEITLDYATFVGYFPEMKSFECHCSSQVCRENITGTDIIDRPELYVKYSGHMSSYVASKAKEHHGEVLSIEESLSSSSEASS